MTDKKRGFAALTPEQHRKISSMGGRAAQDAGVGHRFTTEEAKSAGRKGGIAPHPNGRGGRSIRVAETAEA